MLFDDRPLLQKKSSGARLPPVPFPKKLCGRTTGSLSLRQHQGLLLHLHHPLLPSQHERTDLHRDAILWPPHAAPPPTGGFPASVSNGGQQAAEEVNFYTPELFLLETKSPVMVMRLPRLPIRVSFSFRKMAAKRMVTTGIR